MRYSILLLLLLFFVASCKKPKKGFWQLTFKDQANNIVGSYVCERQKFSKELSHDGAFQFNPYNVPIPILRAQIYYDNTTLSGGPIVAEDLLNGNYYNTITYTSIQGTLSRKSGSGTVNIEQAKQFSNSSGTYDSIVKQTGSFELEWTSKDRP